jgi:HEAT repeat protein
MSLPKTTYSALAIFLGVIAAFPQKILTAEQATSRVLIAQSQAPLLVNVASPTKDLIHALEHSDLKYQRRYAAELLGGRDETALPALLFALRDPEEVVQLAAAESLAKIGTASIFPELVENLSSSRPTVRKYSAYVLGRKAKNTDQEVVQALEALTADPVDNVRAEVFYALCEISSVSSRDIFIQGLNDSDTRVRRYSAAALGKIKGSDASRALAFALQRETSEDVRRMIASALGKVGSSSSVDALIDALPLETPAVRIDIATALGEAKTPRAITALTELLIDDSNAQVREKAAIALRDAKAQSAVESLAKALKDRAVIVRRPASEALIDLADTSVADQLVDALDDTDDIVADNATVALIKLNSLDSVHGLIEMLENPNSRARERAIRALEEITLRPYGANIEKWKKWYDEFFRIGG